MQERAVRVARRFVPGRQLVATTIIRAVIGGSILLALPLIPPPFDEWGKLAGKIFIIMGAMALFGHWEKQFTTHVLRACELGWLAYREQSHRRAPAP